MIVTIELFGIHRETAGKEKIEFTIGKKTLVRDALNYVREKYPSLTIKEHSVLITVNHELASPDRPLKANDTVCILPHIGGG